MSQNMCLLPAKRKCDDGRLQFVVCIYKYILSGNSTQLLANPNLGSEIYNL